VIVYDVIVNGEIKETIKPTSQRLKDMYAFVTEQINLMKKKYGYNIKINRRVIY
jgi:hypothetical protein